MSEVDFDLVIIGTGPSGIAAAREACSHGIRVLIVDGGLKYEPLDPLPDDSKRNYRLRAEFPTKTYFGSDFATRKHSNSNIEFDSKVGCVSSAATGGLSSIWGGCAFPFRAQDIKEWPYEYSELLAGYEKIFKYVPLAGAQDWSAEFKPAKLNSQLSPTDASLKNFISKVGYRSTSRYNFQFMESLLAVDNRPDSPNQCIQCGKCLSGCEVSAIFCSSNEIPHVQKLGAKYLSGLYVTHLQETDSGVVINGYIGSKRTGITCKRVAVAAGSISSTALALSASTVEIAEINDSQSFTLPMLVTKSMGSTPSTMSLPTNFVEVLCSQTGKSVSHLQIYPHGPEMKEALNTLTKLKPINRLVSNLIFPFAIMAHGFLDESLSGKLQIQKFQHPSSAQPNFSVTAVSNPASAKQVQSICKQLANVLRGSGIVPLSKLVHISRVGGSFHTGASFPLTEGANEGKSDYFGRPYRLKRIHLVDASSLPSIPPQSPTITVMAHAHILVERIARGLASGVLEG